MKIMIKHSVYLLKMFCCGLCPLRLLFLLPIRFSPLSDGRPCLSSFSWCLRGFRCFGRSWLGGPSPHGIPRIGIFPPGYEKVPCPGAGAGRASPVPFFAHAAGPSPVGFSIPSTAFCTASSSAARWMAGRSGGGQNFSNRSHGIAHSSVTSFLSAVPS